MRKIEREVYLKVLDTLWMQHLENMQHLREGIHWRSVGQRDPLVEYRSESQKLFDGLQRNLREEVLKILLSILMKMAIKLKTLFLSIIMKNITTMFSAVCFVKISLQKKTSKHE